MTAQIFADEPPLVLVTGASGFIASHIVNQLLDRGDVRVRGTVRSLKNKSKIAPLRALYPDSRYPLELVEADLLNAQSWIEAVTGCTYVLHVASPIPVAIPRGENELVQPALEGTLSVLRACADSNTVKRVVITSSLGAVSVGMYGEDGREYTEEDWSPEHQCPPYENSKLLAERAAWDFVSKLDENKSFELVTILPGTAIGPLAYSAATPISIQVVESLIGNKVPALIQLHLSLVDVRDIAQAHIIGMLKPEAAGKRFIVTCKDMWMKELSEIIAKEFEPQGYKMPSWHIPKPGLWLAKFFNSTLARVYPALGKCFTYNTEQLRNVLCLQPKDINVTILDTCYDLIERGRVPKTPSYRGRPEVSDNQSDTVEQRNEQIDTS